MSDDARPVYAPDPERGQSQTIRKLKEKKRQRRGRLNEDIDNILEQCQAQLREAASLSPYLADQDLVRHGDIEQINNHARIFSRDLVALRQQLDEIRGALSNKQFDDEDADDISMALRFSEHLYQWQERFERLVTPTLGRLSTLLQQAAERRENLRKGEQQESDDE